MSLQPEIVIVDDDKKYGHRHDLMVNINSTLPALVNSLRRVMLSEIPNVGFDQTPHEDVLLNRIRIVENNSALHNEFLSHRIALVPICSYNSGRLNIKSCFNKKTCKRDTSFWFAEELPEFSLQVRNDDLTRLKYKSERPNDIEKDDDIILVTTYDLNITTPGYPEPTDAFITQDVITSKSNGPSPGNVYKNYILLNKLKVGSNGKGENLDIVCRPTIGVGETHTSYSPVGTVSYKFIQDSRTEVQDMVFGHYLENLSNERKNKGLNPFDDKERKEIRASYNHLDAKRVFHRDEKGNANSIQLHIESIGGMLPIQILENSINVLSWKLRDILTCCPILEDDNNLQYNLLDKISIDPSPTKMDSYEIKIIDEGHTIGNVVTKYLQDMYLGKLLQFVSYVKTHPLENKIIFRLKLADGFNHVKYINWLHENRDLVNENLSNVLDNMVASGNISKLTEDNTIKFIYINIFLQGVNAVLKNLQLIKTQFTSSPEVINIKKTIKNDNFLNFSESTNTKEWYPNVDNLGNSRGNLQDQTLYKKLETDYLSLID